MPRTKNTSATVTAVTEAMKAPRAITICRTSWSCRSVQVGACATSAAATGAGRRPPRRARMASPAPARTRNDPASSRSGSWLPKAPTSRPPRAGPPSIPIVPAVWVIDTALGRSSSVTISGVSALSAGCVSADPSASTATRAIIVTGVRVWASTVHTPACASAVVTINTRLSTRSANQPAGDPKTASGRADAISRAATPRPWSPEACRVSASAWRPGSRRSRRPPAAARLNERDIAPGASRDRDAKDILRK